MPFVSRRFIVIVSLFAALALPVSAWAPTHRVTTRKGTIYLRPLESNSVLFSFRPAESAQVGSLENSELWDPDFINLLNDPEPITELKVGQALILDDGSQLFTFLDPVSGGLAFEVRYRDGDGTVSRSVSLELQGDRKPFQKKLVVRAPFIDHLYGLGEQFPQSELGQTVVDWKGKLRHSGAAPDSLENDPKGVYGNSLTPLAGGNVANALFPVLYMADETGGDALLFIDSPVDSRWDFRGTPWTVHFRGEDVSGALAWGEESLALRKRYMAWTGRAPIPPRKAFGLWVSEYGYENWAELESKASTLKEAGFPVDGFVLDLQWFGGIVTDSPDSKMGRVAFDEVNFPNPAQKIRELAARGLGLIVIEESYISQNLPEYADLAEKGYMVKSPSEPAKPLVLDDSTWWGLGSMLDYTNPEVGAYWHTLKRRPLVDMGILGHWTDLGEPEVFRHKKKQSRGRQDYETPIYHNGKTQLEANNFFGFSWAKSIFDGFGKDGRQSGPRPFILARTGTSGIQRFGTALWSGDIGANWRSLRSHYVGQSHMSFSGIDYYGSDVGGFFREAFEGEEGGVDELYTRWFAAACLTDVPLRPHTMNLGNKYETAPDRVGDVSSNLKNLRLRYRLIPYLYSASYKAWTEGAPLVSPLALAEDSASGPSADSALLKMVGPGLLARLVLEPGSVSVDCPLPAGTWYDFATGEQLQGGKTLERPSRAQDGAFVTPLFAKAGSLIPLGSAQTSEPDHARLEVAVFPGQSEGRFELYHDDGKSEAYRGGDFAVTEIAQSDWRGRFGRVTVQPVKGSYAKNMPSHRDVVLRVAYSGDRLQATVDGEAAECRKAGGYWVVTVPETSVHRRLEVNFE